MNTNERFISPLLQKDKADMPFVLEKPRKTLDDLVLPEASVSSLIASMRFILQIFLPPE
ncbi:MAG: hypothetical protein SO005_08335 [Candidatus Choladocola sp.]|nr:hypothetical protein [Candidatus Choladocola sp.]